MEKQFDLSILNDLSVETSYKKKLLDTKSTKNNNRKINSYHSLKLKGINNQKTNAIHSQKNEASNKLSESLNLSPKRYGLKASKSIEKLTKQMSSLVSSPLMIHPVPKEKKTIKDLKENSLKLEKNKQQKLKKKMSDSISQYSSPKNDTLVKKFEDRLVLDAKKIKNRYSVDKIHRIKPTTSKANEIQCQKPLGTSKLITKDKNFNMKLSGEDELTIQNKLDHETSRKISTKIKNYFKTIEKKSPVKEEISPKSKGLLNNDTQNYLKKKIKKNPFEKKIEEDTKEKERNLSNDKLDKSKKNKSSKRLIKNKIKLIGNEGKDKSATFKIIKPKKSKKNQESSHEFSLTGKLEKYKINLAGLKKQLLIETTAARKIQRWYKSLKRKEPEPQSYQRDNI